MFGQGEQRTLAAHFVKAVVASKDFLPAAFSSGDMMEVMLTTLSHLPTTVENAADSTLRQKLFEYKVNEDDDYSGAAKVLSEMRMDDVVGSVYYMSPSDTCDILVKVAECYLEEDETVAADAAVTKAGSAVESIANPEENMAIILRYKSTCARVLDANRKFIQAGSRYHELSQADGDMIDSDELLNFLGRAVTCAILAPSSSQRKKVLGLLFKDSRLPQLDSITEFQSHSSILKKMYMNQIIPKDDALKKFESSLAVHQKAVMGDGLTIMERGVIEHNMIGVSKLFRTIYFSELGRILGVSTHKAEKIAATMIMEGSLVGSIDQVEGILSFDSDELVLQSWDEAIDSFCVQLNSVTEEVKLSMESAPMVS
eukprot:CAMPEP_0118673972 /NCGR_PEP_ID=MMETSP0800-20121206/631_1 /TAXON_ID=210618 ORGANISM="Striatella unipunctata, Strain CCMP2910" /NCGR_SAMPLE_ID=MMETSP0800 /ASSEMBLY_ACC=CAM_ASM_000638 /LENGTH=369 /DNA_ID=CAMNT_0006569119 /DNA_START=42 /DNA_END=1151 /DNA_ORIENTATION=+